MKLAQILLLPVMAVFFIGSSELKNSYKLSENFAISINGTSNLHNWSEKVGSVNGNAIIQWNSDSLLDLQKLNIEMKVLSIKSTKGSVMNNKTYKALKSDLNPQIVFILTEPVKLIKINAEKIFYTKGTLNIAGVTKHIDIKVKILMQQNKKLLFEGVQKIKMSDYGIKPPTALLGSLKTGDDISIDFKTVFILN